MTDILEKFEKLSETFKKRQKEWLNIRIMIKNSLKKYEKNFGKSEDSTEYIRQIISCSNTTQHTIYYTFNKNRVNIHIKKNLIGEKLYEHGIFSIDELLNEDLDTINSILFDKIYNIILIEQGLDRNGNDYKSLAKYRDEQIEEILTK